MPNEGQKEGPLLKRLSSKVKQASIRYGLFSKGDKLAIALSGGKDSLALVALLGTLRGPLQLDLVAIHIAFPGSAIVWTKTPSANTAHASECD